MQIRVEVCDMCHDPNKKVEHYRLSLPGQRLRRWALCADDAKPLLSFGEVVTKKSGEPSRRVVDMDEIEQLKETRRRPARKAAARTAVKK